MAFTPRKPLSGGQIDGKELRRMADDAAGGLNLSGGGHGFFTQVGSSVTPPATSSSAASATYVNVTSAAPNAAGYYSGTADTYAAGVWTTGPACSVKNLEGKPLAQGHRVVAFAVDPDGTTQAYLTQAGGFTGTTPRMIGITCVGGVPTATLQTDTYVNAGLISSV